MSDAATLPLRPWVEWTASEIRERIVALTLVAAIVATSAYLSPFWRESPELSHGWFAPVCALALLWQSRREPNLASTWTPATRLIATIVAAVATLLVGSVAALAALVQGPLHSQAAFLTAVTLTCFLLTGMLALGGRTSALVRFNGVSLCGALLWCTAAPLPSGTLARFTLFLQNIITEASVHAVHWFGLPATRSGNIIRLSNALVGVEEACSGIRSLTACLFAGLVLGGFMLHGLPRRLLLFVAAGVVAVFTNFIRSVTLCLLAAHGVEINGFWHDTTAFAVLGATLLILFAGASLLASPRVASSPAPTSDVVHSRLPIGSHLGLSAIVAVMVLLVAAKIAPRSDANQPPPDLAQLTVLDEFGWARRADESIYGFSDALNTTYLRQDSYFRGDTQLTLYVAYWPPNQATLGSVALHTPEICLPGSGWTEQPPPPTTAAYPLPDPRRFLFEKAGFPQHVWFWHYYDANLVRPTAGLYPWQLAPALLKPAVSVSAPQWVVRISSNKPLETLRDEPLVREFFARLRRVAIDGAGSP